MINKNIIAESYDKQVCVTGFNVENFDMLEAVIRGASVAKSPVVIQTTQAALNYVGTDEMVKMFNIFQEKYNVETILHYDHGKSYEEIKQVIEYGYASVMADLTTTSKENYLMDLDKIYNLCKKKNVKLELEIGNIPVYGQEVGYTNLDEIKKINDMFEIDSFAVSVGSIHGCQEKKERIDFRLLETIHNEINKPLVIHGSSGLSDTDLRILYQYGVSKVNIETELRLVYKNALKEAINLDEIRPRVLGEYVKTKIIDYIILKYKILRNNNE